jgi:glycosyltransferase A (GT-A) superfamily protein (DUF2064 family)
MTRQRRSPRRPCATRCSPQVHRSQLEAFDPARYDACLGLADDGGYWAIGLRAPAVASRVIHGVPMSTARTGAVQLERLRDAGLRVQLLDLLADVDTMDVAAQVAALAPETAFARTVRSLDVMAAPY